MSNRKGMAMLIVVAMILMLLILGGAVLMISTGHFSTSYHQIKRVRAYYAAEAAMHHLLWDLRTNGVTPGSYTLPGTFDVNGIQAGQITITVSPPDGQGIHTIDIDIPDY